MDIFVCIKQVPDTASSIMIDESKNDILRSGLNYVMNPYDEYGVEEALKVKEKYKDCTVTLVSASPYDVSMTLRMGLAMGADKAIQVKDSAIEGSDSLSTAKILAKVIGKSKFDLIFTGKQAVDDDCAQVGPMVAQILDIPVATVAVKFELSDDKRYAVVHREIEGAIEVVKLKLPCLVSAQKGLNVPRLPTLTRIMQAKRKEILESSLSDIGLSASDVGTAAAKIKRTGLCAPKERTGGVVLQGELPDIVSQLVKLLKEKEKVL